MSEPILDTAEVGPRVATARDALQAVRWYAAHPDGRPRPEPLHRALWGLGTSLQAGRLVWTDRRLFRAALGPTLLTALGCALLAAWSTWRADPDDQHGGTTFQAFLVSFVALSSMPPTLLQRSWIRVANEARRALGLSPGEEPFPDETYLGMLWREGLKAVRQTVVVSAGLLPVVVVFKVLPLGPALAAALLGGWAFYWVVLDAFELPIEVITGPRHGGPRPWFSRLLEQWAARWRWLRILAFGWTGRMLRRLCVPWQEEIRFSELHPWETAGCGLAIGAVLATPVVGLFFRAVAITAATALVGRLGEPEVEPEPAPEAAAEGGREAEPAT